MIFDDLDNFDKYCNLNSNFKIIDKYLKENNLINFKSGSYEIDGRRIYLNIDEYITKNQKETKAEAHREYIDIQIVLIGEEKIGYTNIKNGKTNIEYNIDKDIEFFDAKCDYISILPGYFAVFYPQDIHHPCITNSVQKAVKKAVFKIKIN